MVQKAEQSEDIDKDFLYWTLGKVEEKKGNFRDAIQYYRKALMNCVDNYEARELRQNIKRAKLKRLKTFWKR